MRVEASGGAAGQPTGTDADPNEPVLAFCVALANALAEVGNPPARVQTDATLWVSSAAPKSAITRAELRISVEASGLAASTLEECAGRIARGEDRPSAFGGAEISLTAGVTEAPPPISSQHTDLPRGSVAQKTPGTTAVTLSGLSSTTATVDAPAPDAGSPESELEQRRAVTSGTSAPGQGRRLTRRWIIWLALTAALLMLAYVLARAQQGPAGITVPPYGLLLSPLRGLTLAYDGLHIDGVAGQRAG